VALCKSYMCERVRVHRLPFVSKGGGMCACVRWEALFLSKEGGMCATLNPCINYEQGVVVCAPVGCVDACVY
jgi:hypothetical protein